MKVTKKFNIDENKRIEKIGKNLRRAWKKKKKSTFRAFASRAKNPFGTFIIQKLKSKHTSLKKTYKLRQTKLSQFVYFSLILREREKTKTKYSAPKGSESAQGSDLALVLGDLSQSEKLSEIKLPLQSSFCIQ